MQARAARQIAPPVSRMNWHSFRIFAHLIIYQIEFGLIEVKLMRYYLMD
jgi:hypothetical protein